MHEGHEYTEDPKRFLTDEQLACINGWPEFAVAARMMDSSIIKSIDVLCRFFTYDAICKLLIDIERIWRSHPDWPSNVSQESSCLLGLNNWKNKQQGQTIIQGLNAFCYIHGYGRMSQIAEAISDMYHDPVNGYVKWKSFHDERMTALELSTHVLEESGEENV